MIQKISIQNFKSIVKLELELGRVNVFIGENGCGKTNILEAVAFAGAAAANKLDRVSLFARGARISDNITNMFIDNELSNEMNFDFKTANTEELGFKISIQNNQEFQVEKKLELKENFQETGFYSWQKYQLDLDKKYKTLLSHFKIDNFLIFCPENSFLRKFEEEGQILPLGTKGEGLFKQLAHLQKNDAATFEFIQEKLKVIDWLESMDIPSDLAFAEKRLKIKDRFTKDDYFFDQKVANEGFLFILFYLVLFASKETPNFFAIDNIDTSFNPKLCAKMIEIIAEISEKHDKQVIMTTHNPAVLDGLNLNDNQQRLFTVYRNADGHTVAKRVMPLKKVNGVEMPRLSEAYIRGYLGGLPKNF